MRIKTAVLTGALMLFMLAACGKKEEAPSLPEESTKSDRTASSAQEEPKETEGVSVDMENGQVEEYQNSHAGAPADGEKTNRAERYRKNWNIYRLNI